MQEKDYVYTFLISDGDGYMEKGKWHFAIFQYNSLCQKEEKLIGI